MKSLESIGFYTLGDARCANASTESPLWRCELILTSQCNFTCPYCRGIEEPNDRSQTWEEASFVVRMWGAHGLKNVRFSGGEPTMWKAYENGERRDLADLVRLAKSVGIERIAVSSNGSVATRVYEELVEAGVNDFSISLDACCAATGDHMAGGVKGAWDRVVKNIAVLSKLTYVTVGVVFTEDNIQEFKEIIRFASDDLGIADIRVLTAAQWNEKLATVEIEERFLEKHPILKYRMSNFSNSRHVRGLRPSDSAKCVLMVDDMAVLNGEHYPCIIYMREHGASVGKIDYTLSPAEAATKVREDRLHWVKSRHTKLDPICSKNCLDVCIDHNNRARLLNPLFQRTVVA